MNFNYTALPMCYDIRQKLAVMDGDIMNNQWQERTQMMIGDYGLDILSRSNVIVFGIGGVGGYVVEALARSGIGNFTLVDKDEVSESNINRQIIASKDTVGQYKTEVMKKRIMTINSEAKVEIRNQFFLPDNSDDYDFTKYSYVVDAVDTVTAKLEIIVKAKNCGVPVISAMGAGNKINPAGFKVADIYDTKICPLARVMRRECKKRNIKDLKVIYSEEEPFKEVLIDKDSNKTVPGSMIFAPAACGLIIAAEIVQDLIKKD